MKGYLLPCGFNKKIEIGGPEGYKVKGSILYFPDKCAVLYVSSITGDAEGMGIVTIDVDFLEDSPIFLSRVDEGFQGKHANSGTAFDLSKGAREIEVPNKTIDRIASKAKTAYSALRTFKTDAIDLIFDLERKVADGGKQND